MPRRPSRSRRLATAARWPLGVTLTSWRYMWRTTPTRRSEEPGTPAEHRPPEFPPDVDKYEIQRIDDGVGPIFHRRYRAQVKGSELTPPELVTRLGRDPNVASPTAFAHFQKVRGDEEALRPGDEYVIRMPGPWDGPVRVMEVTPTSFRLATLDGHLEAGQIQFTAESRGEDLLFSIESWARSADRLSDLLYDRVRMAKEIQFHMWTSFLERIVAISGGHRASCFEIRTHRIDDGVEQ